MEALHHLLALVDVHANGLQSVLDVGLELLLLLLGLAGAVGGVDLSEVLPLLHKQLLGFLDCVVEVDVPPVLLRFQVQVLEQLNQPLVELGDLDLGRTVFDLPLQDTDVLVLNSHQLPLLDQLSIFLVELGVNLAQSGGVLILLEVFFAAFGPLQVFVQAFLLLLALALELLLLSGQTSLLFDEGSDCHDLVFLDCTLFDLILEVIGLLANGLELLAVLLLFVLQLGHFLRDSSEGVLDLGLGFSLLLDTLLEFLDLPVVVLLLLHVEEAGIVLDGELLHLLEGVH
mmetsp:Transcript_42011/g.64341  ORF Transcript_42011/g.64341 Transcript_42011/m.64341 type:complete len:286 (-) Transcript_42011:1063-1920(-)|eukprot:CAMPEP_0170493532 /NCGR_PEP_ID=MMETSP0208-20121228/14039_2 /TAXON_ID=197538 /ORGANISM="Strombidium inclinatum, Strain S3" /LENGTH=285 /DNA_ID=CAMNT_0010769471 /DNA_START=146 /DNA_END=1003 /DNA_ORIENTATION=-